MQQGDLISPRGSLDAGTSGFNSRRQTYDLESPLIEQPTAEAAEAEQLRAAARAAEADLFNGGSGDAGAGDPVHDGDRRPSLSSPVYSEHRDSRTLWRLARRNLGASHNFVCCHLYVLLSCLYSSAAVTGHFQMLLLCLCSSAVPGHFHMLLLCRHVHLLLSFAVVTRCNGPACWPPPLPLLLLRLLPPPLLACAK